MLLINELQDERDWIPAKEVCQRIGCCRATITKRCNSGVLEGKYGPTGRLFISRTSINKMLKNLPRFGER